MEIDNQMLQNAKLIAKTLEAQSLWFKGKVMAKHSQKKDLLNEIDELESLLDESETQTKYWQGFIEEHSEQKGGVEDDKSRI